MATTLLDACRKALRIAGNDFDDEITQLIAGAKLDMEMSGVLTDLIDSEDALVAMAITTYVKQHFGLDNPDYEMYARSYASMVAKLKSTSAEGGYGK